jgi:hypothetical protein
MKRSATVLAFLGVLTACELPTDIPPDEAQESLLPASADVFLRNGSMEDSAAWFFRQPPGMTAGYADGQGSNGSRAVKITGTSDAAPESFAYVGQSLAVGDLTDRTLTLTARVRLVDVKGAGVAIALRGDDLTLPSGGPAEVFATT